MTFLFFPFFFIFPFVPFLFPRCVSPLYYPVALPRCWGPSPRASRCRVQVLEPAAVGSKSSSHFHYYVFSFFGFSHYFNYFHCCFPMVSLILCIFILHIHIYIFLLFEYSCLLFVCFVFCFHLFN